MYSLWAVLVTSLLNSQPIKVQRKQRSGPMALLPSSVAGCYLWRCAAATSSRQSTRARPEARSLLMREIHNYLEVRDLGNI